MQAAFTKMLIIQFPRLSIAQSGDFWRCGKSLSSGYDLRTKGITIYRDVAKPSRFFMPGRLLNKNSSERKPLACFYTDKIKNRLGNLMWPLLFWTINHLKFLPQSEKAVTHDGWCWGNRGLIRLPCAAELIPKKLILQLKGIEAVNRSYEGGLVQSIPDAWPKCWNATWARLKKTGAISLKIPARCASDSAR